MTPKEKQRELIVQIMKADENSGLYDEPSRKQTAVDYLFEKLWQMPKDKLVWQHYLEKAKQMEKHQIKEAYQVVDLDIQHSDVGEINSEEYYNETYK
jgi:hypothetical protein